LLIRIGGGRRGWQIPRSPVVGGRVIPRSASSATRGRPMLGRRYAIAQRSFESHTQSSPAMTDRRSRYRDRVHLLVLLRVAFRERRGRSVDDVHGKRGVDNSRARVLANQPARSRMIPAGSAPCSVVTGRRTW